MKEVVEEAYKTSNLDYGEKEAQEWGAGFEWPEDVEGRDEQLAEQCDFDVVEMTRVQHTKTAGERLSRERIEKLVPDTDPDRETLLSLAEGMVVLTAADFNPSGKPQMMRQLYKRVKNAVNKVLLECWKEGLVFLVNRETALKMAEKWGPLHYNAVSWALKKGRREGRYICDSSDASAG